MFDYRGTSEYIICVREISKYEVKTLEQRRCNGLSEHKPPVGSINVWLCYYHISLRYDLWHNTLFLCFWLLLSSLPRCSAHIPLFPPFPRASEAAAPAFDVAFLKNPPLSSGQFPRWKHLILPVANLIGKPNPWTFLRLRGSPCLVDSGCHLVVSP